MLLCCASGVLCIGLVGLGLWGGLQGPQPTIMVGCLAPTCCVVVLCCDCGVVVCILHNNINFVSFVKVLSWLVIY